MPFRRFARSAAVGAVALLTLGACGGDDSDSSSSSQTTTPATTAPTTTAPATTSPPTTSSPNQTVPAADLDAAKQVVLQFVEALGKGDITAAANVVGPVSEEQTNDAGGLRSMLQQSTEGHGAWRSAEGRTVTAIGVEPGIVAVVLEGTLHVEGTTEHRVAVFPARKAESANAWFVEPWAYEIPSAPLRVTTPTVDPEEFATVKPPLEVTVETSDAGTVWMSFDAQPPVEKEVANAGAVTARPESGSAERVTALYHAGPTLYGLGFRVQASDSSTTVPSSAAKVTVPFLGAPTNTLLTACAAGDAASCDAAQVPGVLDDGAFSYFHQRCDGGNRVYCVLFDNLVAAELRMHEREKGN